LSRRSSRRDFLCGRWLSPGHRISGCGIPSTNRPATRGFWHRGSCTSCRISS